jgi:tetratricopeptide (TPR) repeat protein
MPPGERGCAVCGSPLNGTPHEPSCPWASRPLSDPGRTRLPSPGEEVGGFVVKRRLEEGAMGQLLLAHDPGLDRELVLKFMHSRLVGDRRAEDRFLREGRALAGVEHPNVVRVHSVNRWRERPYLAMEYVDGVVLAHAIRGGRLPLAAALRVAEDIAGALAAIHDKRIVHGDVKPANIVLRSRDGSACLLDFGLARTLTSTTASASGAAGTPLYMAPEQIAGRRADMRSDVYAFGVTIYEALTGTVPHEETEGNDFFHSVLHSDAPLVSTRRSDVPQGLETLLGHALARARELRQPDGRAVLVEVRALRRSLAPGGVGTAETVREPTPAELAPPEDPAESLPLLGCDAAYAEAARAIAAVPGGRGCVITVEGAAGAGKSRFLRDLARRARADGLAVLHCGGSESGATPFGALRDALLAHAAAVGAGSPEAAAEFLVRVSPDDEPLVPVLRRVLAPGAAPPEVHDDKAAVARAALALFRAAASERPAALVVDDLHLVDEGSLDAVIALAEEAACMPFAVVVSTRNAAALPRDTPLAARLPRLRAAPRHTSVELGPLPVGAVAAMIHASLRIDEAEACRLAPLLHRRASGNPLFLVECLRLLEQEGRVKEGTRGRTFRERMSELQIPPRMLELALRRIVSLPADERDALGAVAIEPEGVTADFVATCRGTSKLAALRVLQQLVGVRGLVLQKGDRYAIPHAEIRETVYGETIPELRAEYHRLAADAFVAAGEPDAQPARLGRHLRLAGRRAEAVAPLLAAGTALLDGYSPAEALDRLDEAIICAGRGGCPAAEVERARALEMLGELEHARTEFVRLADAPGEAGVAALIRLATFERNRGRDDAASAAVARALASEASNEQRLILHLQRAELASRAGDADDALAALAAAEALAGGAPRLSVLVLWSQQGVVRVRIDRHAEAKEWLQRALTLADEIGAQEHALNCMHNLSLACEELDLPGESIRWAEGAVERAALVGADRQYVFSLLHFATLLLDALRLDEAEATLTRLSESLERLDSDEARYNCCAREAELCLVRGRHANALAVIDRGLALAARSPRHHAGFQLLRAEAFLGLHRTEEAYGEAVQARSAFVAIGADTDAEEALALAARALRQSNKRGAERDELRSLVEPRTFIAALERTLDAESLLERDRWRAAAERLARHARWKAELAASVA